MKLSDTHALAHTHTETLNKKQTINVYSYPSTDVAFKMLDFSNYLAAQSYL